jgi:hypothetical protein
VVPGDFVRLTALALQNRLELHMLTIAGVDFEQGLLHGGRLRSGPEPSNSKKSLPRSSSSSQPDNMAPVSIQGVDAAVGGLRQDDDLRGIEQALAEIALDRYPLQHSLGLRRMRGNVRLQRLQPIRQGNRRLIQAIDLVIDQAPARGAIRVRASAKALRPSRGMACTARVMRCSGACTSSASNRSDSSEASNSPCKPFKTELRMSARVRVRSSMTTIIAGKRAPSGASRTRNDSSNCRPA